MNSSCVPARSSSVLDRRLGKCNPEGLEITPSLLYFGAMVQGEDSLLPFVFRVSNKGDAPIGIREVKITLGSEYFRVVSLNFPAKLPGKDYFDVEVECNPAAIPGIFIGVLEIETDEARQNYTVGMSGRVLASATITNIANTIQRNITNYVDGQFDEQDKYIQSEIKATKDGYTALVNEERWARVSADEAEAGQRLIVEANLRGEIVARVTEEKIARVNGFEAEATMRDAVEARLRDEAKASAEEISRAYASADLAEASNRIALAAELRTETDTKVSAGITAERAVRVTAEEQIAQSVETLRADMQTGNGDTTTYINAKIADERVVTTSAIEASATVTRGLFANYLTTDQVTGAIQSSAAAEVVARETAISTAVGAEASRVDGVIANFSTGAQNMLTNTDLDYDLNGWDTSGLGPAVGGRNGFTDPGYWPRFTNAFVIYQSNEVQANCWFSQRINGLIGGSIIQISAYATSHRCLPAVYVDFYNAAGENVGANSTNVPENGPAVPVDLVHMTRIYLNTAVPYGATYAVIYIGKTATFPGQVNSYAWLVRPQVSTVTSLTAKPVPYIPGNYSAAIIQANARVDSEASARTSAIGAEAQRVDTLLASYATNGALAAAISAEVINRDTAVASAVGAEATRTNNLVANYTSLSQRAADINRMNARDDEVVNYAIARIADEAIARTNAISAESTAIRGIFASYASTGALNNAISAEVIQRDRAIASASGSLSQSITEVRGIANGASGTAGTALSVAQGADGKANSALARWAMTLDVNGYISGIEANNNGSTSSLTFNSDLIQFRKPGGGAGLNMAGGELWATDPQGNKRARFGYWG